MKENILIVEDEFIVGNDLSLILKKAGYNVCGIAATVDEGRAMVDKYNPTWVLLDIFLQDGSKGTELAGYLTEKKIGFVYISANTNQRILEEAKLTQPYGFVVKPFRQKDLLIMLEIAMEKHQQNEQFELMRRKMLDKQLHDILLSHNEASEKLEALPGVFQAFIPFDLMKVVFPKTKDPGLHEFVFIREEFEKYQHFQDTQLPESMKLAKRDLQAYRPTLPAQKKGIIFNGMEFRHVMFDDPWERILCSHFELKSKLSYPISLPNGLILALMFYSKNPDGFTPAHISLLWQSQQLIGLLTAIIQKDSAPLAVGDSKQEVIRINNTKFDGIIGKSPELLKVLDNISLVSQTDISVLIYGESGTGKEKVAQNIHKLSPRRQKPLITVNCAALPHELIESELFGHEKGAYTGAIEKRIGKFELANGGTIFLDEIGEMPLEAQVKLLRVLQEKEIEHIGGKQSIKVDVRVIAATNRKLEQEVAEGRFRLDLYYRLNVYPVELPPLRDRKQDIPLLAQYFLEIFAKETGRKISGFSAAALAQLQSYDWPGNIRELGHLIQRSMIMSSGTQINSVVVPETIKQEVKLVERKEVELKTLEQMEKEHILGILKRCSGKVCGAGGAAEVLGLPPSTLNSKMKKLGIKRESYFNF
ncbi:sigma-54 dependent transcriptional regulator [Mucilaginibacter kameinonensis]|uniref:sigma-54 dependent transcriptional regulator n=1 Tax=Mucilaginibacter kameinonensis TaxID=452286 RepID=UPI000EF7F5CD|nr:sigma 54-interacting transcriptional regulator [Mucilaginibacter kameinonensis]